jgi:peptide/nickel transport system permease protein
MTDMAIRPIERRYGTREQALVIAALCILLLGTILSVGTWYADRATALDAKAILQSPSLYHLFGTDALGRDLLVRTVVGLSLSLRVGLLASAISTVIAVGLALVAVTGGKWADAIVSYLVDMTLGLPHLMLLILVSFALGGGTTAVIIAVAVTHWPRVTRILRAEFQQVLTSDYVQVSRQFGKSWGFIARQHLLPHALPQALVGFLLLFPHAILHEAGLTFLGFGFEPSRPAVGVLLAESMRYLASGSWWLALFPGVSLIVMVLAFDGLAAGLRSTLDPREAHL